MEFTEFPEVLKKEHVEIPRDNLKRSGISRSDEEKIVPNFHGSRLFALEFQRVLIQFCKISREEALVKNSFFFLKKYVLKPTWIFSGIAQCSSILQPKY